MNKINVLAAVFGLDFFFSQKDKLGNHLMTIYKQQRT